MTFTHGLSTNNYGPAKFIVATSAANGTHTTLATALAVASVGDTVWLRDSVTENVTLPAGVNIQGINGPASANIPSITGTITMTAAGTSTISNLRLVTNSAPFATVSGSAASLLFITSCYFDITNNTGISYSSSSGSSAIEISYCQGNFSSGTGIALYSMSSSGRLNIRHCSIRNSAGTSTASDNSAGIVQLFNSDFTIPFSSSSTGALNVFPGCNIDTSASNTLSVTVNGTGGGRIDTSEIVSGSASSVSIGTGNTFSLSQLSISSTNTNPITGAGTAIYTNIAFRGTGNTINTTTQTPRFSSLGAYRATGQPSFLATKTAAQSNVTGSAGTPTIGYSTEVFDQASNYDGVNTFTAPITGRYFFVMSVRFSGLTAAMTQGQISINTSNRNYNTQIWSYGVMRTVGNIGVVTMSCFGDMDAADTALCTINIINGAGDVVSLDASATQAYFSGYLVC